MDEKVINDILNNIENKIGSENHALIVDDIANIITKNKEVYDSLQSKNNEIESLKNEKNNLIIANGNLLKQIPVAKDNDEDFKIDDNKKDEKEVKNFDFKSLFDKNGNFKED